MRLTISRYAFIPQLIVFSILFGVSSSNYDLSTISHGDARTIAGHRYSGSFSVISISLTRSGYLGSRFALARPLLMQELLPISSFTTLSLLHHGRSLVSLFWVLQYHSRLRLFSVLDWLPGWTRTQAMVRLSRPAMEPFLLKASARWVGLANSVPSLSPLA